MTPTTLRFRARGTALVQNHERLEAGINSFVGRRFLEVSPGQYGWCPTNETAEVPYSAEYVKACKDGDLWAADRETADACLVAFDPTFGVARAAEKQAEKAADKPAAKPAEKG